MRWFVRIWLCTGCSKITNYFFTGRASVFSYHASDITCSKFGVQLSYFSTDAPSSGCYAGKTPFYLLASSPTSRKISQPQQSFPNWVFIAPSVYSRRKRLLLEVGVDVRRFWFHCSISLFSSLELRLRYCWRNNTVFTPIRPARRSLFKWVLKGVYLNFSIVKETVILHAVSY